MWFCGPSVKTLSGLTIGSLTLSPAFDSGVTEYSASTTNATNKITATATNAGDTVTILNGSTAVTNGQSATWASGENVITITVSDGFSTKVYTVTVTYTPATE